MVFKLGLVLEYDILKDSHPLPSVTQDILLYDIVINLTQGQIISWMKEKDKYGYQNKLILKQSWVKWE